MERREIASGIFIKRHHPPFNLGAVRLDDGCVVVNTPPIPEASYAWRREAQAFGGRIRYLVITNADALHLVGALLWQVPLILSPAAADIIDQLDERNWEILRQEAEEALQGFDIEALRLLSLPPRPPYLIHGPRATLHAAYDGRPRTLTAFTVPDLPNGALWLRLEEESLLFADDSILIGEAPLVARGVDRQAWLERIIQLASDPRLHLLVPGRGEAPIHPARLEEMVELWRMMEHSARTLAARPQGEGVGQATQALRQTFFPHKGKRSNTARRLHESLDNWAADLRGDPESDEEEDL